MGVQDDVGKIRCSRFLKLMPLTHYLNWGSLILALFKGIRFLYICQNHLNSFDDLICLTLDSLTSTTTNGTPWQHVGAHQYNLSWHLLPVWKKCPWCWATRVRRSIYVTRHLEYEPLQRRDQETIINYRKLCGRGGFSGVIHTVA